MINFDEEIQKFHPALEVQDVENTVRDENAAEDLTDLMLKIMALKENEKPNLFDRDLPGSQGESVYEML